jgi:hypothetical protein
VGKVWVLDTDTKGTGASMVPLEKAHKKVEPRKPAPRRPKRLASKARPRARGREPQVGKTSTALPPGHVRKKGTGEIGQVQAVDPRAGTARVRWLKGGRVSTVPLSAVSRR